MRVLTLIGLVFTSAAAFAGVKDRLYDFTDDYYRLNGVDPAMLAGRKQAPSLSAVIDNPNFWYQRNVRIIGTSAGYDADGKPVFFSVMAGFGPDGFTKDKAGAKARQIADKYPEYLFPKLGTDPVGLGASRQSALQDTRNGYFSNDPLGLWIHVWINYTDKAFNTSGGKKALTDLAKKHGYGLDGTPIIATASEIDDLYSKGYVTKLTRNDGLRYAVCPEIRDPRNGGIAPDAFLNYLKLPDGTPLEPSFVNTFNNLQRYGRLNP